MATELFTVATKPDPGLTRLQASLTKFSVPLTVLGQNEAEYWGHCWRWKTVIRAARESSADIVMHCDGYDVMCLDSLSSVESKFASLNHPIVFGYEPQVQPEFWLGLQTGIMIAERDALIEVF